MIITDFPGETDAKAKKLLCGPEEKRLAKALKPTRIDSTICRYTSIVKCHPDASRKPTKKTIKSCRPLLDQELADYAPETVFTLGDIAFEALYPGKLKSYHGAPASYLPHMIPYSN